MHKCHLSICCFLAVFIKVGDTSHYPITEGWPVGNLGLEMI